MVLCKCGTKASFGIKNTKKAEFCKNCMNKDTMENVTRKKCEVCNDKTPTYGFISTDKNIKPIATHCKDCKTTEMRDINHRNDLCPCGTRACFGFKDDKKATCCNKCLKTDMINLKDKNNKCIKCKSTMPTYGFISMDINIKSKATHCKKCSLLEIEDMEDVKHKNASCKCPKKNRANFGFIGHKPTHCSECKIKDMFDLTHKKCEVCKEVQATFGLISKKPTHCLSCKTEKMKSLKDKLCKCGTVPTFGYINQSPIACVKCKKYFYGRC